MGEVTHPGAVQLQAGRLTILQALAMAGGFKEFANTKDVQVLRPKGRRQQRRDDQVQLQGRRSTATRKPFYLRPGDTVIVP